MANKFRDISVDEYKKLSEEEQKNFKEVIKKTFLGFNKVSMENQAEEARSEKRKREAQKKNFDVMSGIWKQSKITSTAVKVVSNHWGKILGLAIFLLPKKFWLNLKDTIFRIYNFFKGKTLSQVWSEFVNKNLGKVVAGIGILASMFAPRAAFMVAMAGFQTLMLGFKGMKWAGGKIIGGPKVTTGGVMHGPKLPKNLAHDAALKENAEMKKKAAGSKVKGRMLPILGKLGKIVGWTGVAFAAGDALNKGFFSPEMKGKSFGDKITRALATFAGDMTLNLVSAEWIEKMLKNVGTTITDAIKNTASSLTLSIVNGIEYIRNFDWDREVKRLRDARKNRVNPGDEIAAQSEIDHLEHKRQQGTLTDTDKTRYKAANKILGREVPSITEQVGTGSEQRQGIVEAIARAQKNVAAEQMLMEKATGKFLPGSDKAKAANRLSSAKRKLREQEKALKQFDATGPLNAPAANMGAESARRTLPTGSGHGLITTPSPITPSTASKASYPKIPDDGGTTNMDGVKWSKMHKSGRSGVEAAIWEIYNNHGKKPVFVSGLRDKDHALYNPKSQHAYGLGFDLRSKQLGSSKDAISNDLHRVFNQKGWFMQEEIAGQSNTTGTKATGDHFHIHKAAKGFHGVVESATGFIAGEAGSERVDITPLNGPNAKLTAFNNLQNQNLDAQRMGSGGGTTIVAPTTNNNSSQATTAVLANPNAKDTFWEKT